jgi:succinate dehydrogenase/fumarate reductase flavoprotein subunit
MTVDVVVVGFGAAGMAAAIEAHDAGSTVVVLEKMPAERAGGNTRVSGNVWCSPEHVELAEDYLRALSDRYPLPEPTISAWARETAGNDAWMRARLQETAETRERHPRDRYAGIEITTAPYGQEAARSRGDTRAAYHEWPELAGNDCGNEFKYIGPTQGYSRLWFTLKAAIEQRGIEVRFDTRAQRLLQDEDGAVTGVLVEGPDGPVRLHTRRGVVLASGGFVNSPDLVKTHLRLPYATPMGSPGSTGDGLRMAQKAGASLSHMGSFCGVNGGVGFENAGFSGEPKADSRILVADDGRRFIDEFTPWRHGKTWLGGSAEHWPARSMHNVFDERALRAGPISPPLERYPGTWARLMLGYEWSDDNAAEVERGWIARGDSLRELAEALKIDPDGLAASVAEYNRACAEGHDARFGRPAETLSPLEGPPYYGYTWANVLLYTCGGPRKDERARVLDAFDEPIAGLYCAGEISSTYSWMMSGGLMIGDALAFGRIAGREAASG